MNEKDYEVHVQLISEAGDSRSKSLMAIEAAREGRFDEAESFLTEASEVYIKAHDLQMKMLQQEAEGNPIPINIIAVHAQDHLTMATLTESLAREQIALYRRLQALEEKLGLNPNK